MTNPLMSQAAALQLLLELPGWVRMIRTAGGQFRVGFDDGSPYVEFLAMGLTLEEAVTDLLAKIKEKKS